MGFFDKFRREKRSTEGAVTLEQLLGGNETLTVKIAMQVPAVAYCVEMIASAAAMLPVKLYIRKSDGETEEITDDPRITLLNGQTGDTMNADNMRRVWVRDFLLTGSAFAYIETRYGMPCALKYIPSGAVGVMSSDTDYIHKHFSYIVTGKEIFPHQMLKILRNSDGFGRGRGIVGESPLIMDTMYQLLKFQKNQVLKGGNKRGFLKSDAPVRKEVKDDIEEKWRQLNSNDDSAERIMFLNGNIDFKEMSSTAVEMQLNENVQTNDAEIMRLFGTADGILSPETVKNAVMPVLDVFEAAFDSDLLLESEKADHYFAFDTKELTRGDISTRYSAYATALQNNFMQLDEVRALEDLPPLGFNYITLGLQNVLVNPKTGEVYTPNTNAVANMNRLGNVSGTDNDSTENRADLVVGEGGYLQDPSTGRMMGRVGTGGSANVSEKEVDKPVKPAIIKEDSSVPSTLAHFDEAQAEYLESIKDEEMMKPENRAAVESALKDLIDNNDFCMRVSEETLGIIADSEDQRFKTQIELRDKNKTGGFYDPEGRKDASSKLFGNNQSEVKDSEYEKYGFLAGKDKSKVFQSYVADNYGDIIVEFDKGKISERTTFTCDDSLAALDMGGAFASKVTAPSVCAVELSYQTETIDAVKNFKGKKPTPEDFNSEVGTFYTELQFHGELNLGHVTKVYYQDNFSPDLKTKLEKQGIEVIKV